MCGCCARYVESPHSSIILVGGQAGNGLTKWLPFASTTTWRRRRGKRTSRTYVVAQVVVERYLPLLTCSHAVATHTVELNNNNNTKGSSVPALVVVRYSHILLLSAEEEGRRSTRSISPALSGWRANERNTIWMRICGAMLYLLLRTCVRIKGVKFEYESSRRRHRMECRRCTF